MEGRSAFLYTFEIWCEGYRATGESAIANKFGEIKANSFQEACDKYFSRPGKDERGDYNSKNLTFWGCRLFDNEADARKNFG